MGTRTSDPSSAMSNLSRPRRRRRPRRPAMGRLLNPTSCSLSALCRRHSAGSSWTGWRQPFAAGRARLLRRTRPARRPRRLRRARVRVAPEPLRRLRQAPVRRDPSACLAYLARYTHRTAIANSRIFVAVDDDHGDVLLQKIIAAAAAAASWRLAPHEFIRRFLLHVLPDGFHRIRHYGFPRRARHRRPQPRTRARPGERQIHRRVRRKARRVLADPQPQPKADDRALAPCPDCGGRMRRVSLVPPSAGSFRCDTS